MDNNSVLALDVIQQEKLFSIQGNKNLPTSRFAFSENKLALYSGHIIDIWNTNTGSFITSIYLPSKLYSYLLISQFFKKVLLQFNYWKIGLSVNLGVPKLSGAS